MSALSNILGADGQPLVSDTSHRAASRTSRELSSWTPGIGSADSDLNHEIPTLVSRSRDLIRNHGVASGGIQTLTDNVVGIGLRLSAKPDYVALGKSKESADEWSKQVESLWRGWAESTDCDATQSLNFAGLTTLVFRSVLENGEALALPLWLPNKSGPYATKLQLIESDRLENPHGQQDGEKLRGGIELDNYGGAKGYWVRKHHPGDYFQGVKDNSWKRISARTVFGRERVLHVLDKQRIGQHRSKPILTSIMPMFKMLDHYERSELQAAVVNAMIAAFIETPMDMEGINELFGGSQDDYLKARKEWSVKLQGGAVIPVFPGDKVAPFTPGRPNSGYADFVENILRHIGTGLNLPYELLMKDFSKTNYASARAALMEAWRFFIGRRTWLGQQWASRVYALWLEEIVNKQLIDAPNFYQAKNAWLRCRWIGPGRGWIDPVKEAKASQIRMDIGLSTLEEECATQGLDWEDVLEQRARERLKMQELGIIKDEQKKEQNQRQRQPTSTATP